MAVVAVNFCDEGWTLVLLARLALFRARVSRFHHLRSCRSLRQLRVRTRPLLKGYARLLGGLLKVRSTAAPASRTNYIERYTSQSLKGLRLLQGA